VFCRKMSGDDDDHALRRGSQVAVQIAATELTENNLLPQTDRAMRCVSQNVVDCRNKLYDKSTTNRSNGVKRITVDQLVVNSHDSPINVS